ncbi:MAG: sporulation protein [Thermofilaceae archaeon]
MKIDLALSKYLYALGEEVEGSLSVVSEEVVDSDEIRIEFTCVESNKVRKRVYNPSLKREVETETWESTTLHNQKIPLSGPLHFEPGSAATFKFSFAIPPTLPPTIKSASRRVEYRVKGVVAVRRRPDTTSRTIEISVAEPGSVKRNVKCLYCGTMYPEDLTNCPHCGAPRTR